MSEQFVDFYVVVEHNIGNTTTNNLLSTSIGIFNFVLIEGICIDNAKRLIM